MSDPTNYVESDNVSEQMYTQQQLEEIVAEVIKRVREAQLEESDRRQEGSALPVEISEELEEYSVTELQRALQKFKRATHKYNNREWITPETTNPNFVNQLKEEKVDTLQLVNIIYRLTENTRVQAKAATELYEHLKFIQNRGFTQEDVQLFKDSVEQSRRLAVYGLGIAKQQENEAKEITTKALKLPHSLKHLEIASTSEKRYAFDEEFVEQYYDETYKQKLTNNASRVNQQRENMYRGEGRGNNGSRSGHFFFQRGKGRGQWNNQATANQASVNQTCTSAPNEINHQ